MSNVFDLGELVKRTIKYLVEGVMVAIAAYAIPKRSLNLDEVALIALTAAATFSILDTYIPSRCRVRYRRQPGWVPYPT